MTRSRAVGVVGGDGDFIYVAGYVLEIILAASALDDEWDPLRILLKTYASFWISFLLSLHFPTSLPC
uniref:Uncharacterized protein n=1 Tax=Rhizophora mucronata TaxID=61149 RepID=A0A2P2N508_RHIMU